ncbi:hypothetical protein [Ohtaekwangia sp.]|uniref:hypothetical protein n=1 Tax=Ohtaekwangia sp. TaxID=2066019 RepID=UPI002FDCD120
MKILQDLKENVFKVIEHYMPLEEFELWLYSSDELINLMNEDVVLEVFAFNYRQSDAGYQFRKAIFKFFKEDEFLLWKVKANLRDLITNNNNRDRILYDFYYLGYDGYYFLTSIGYYMYHIEDVEYSGNDLKAVLGELRHNCEKLLSEIEKQELDKPGFRLEDYRSEEKQEYEIPVVTHKWWNFWK